MRKCSLLLLMSAMTGILTVPAHALTVSAIIGDKDGFGTGLVDGSVVMPWDIIKELDDELFTDEIVYGTQTLSFAYDLSVFEDVTSATLTVFTGGQGLGLFATTELYVDGVYAGLLTDGEIGLVSFAREDVFDLTTFATVLAGATTIEVRTKYGVDAWVLDYAELVFTGTAAPTTPTGPLVPVPEPASLSILGIGLAGMVLRQRKFRTSAA